MGLLSEVGRCVITRDGVLGENEAQRNDEEEERNTARGVVRISEAGVIDPGAEHLIDAQVALRTEDQDGDHDDRAEDVPPHRDVIHEGEQLAREDIDGTGDQ